MFRYLFDLVYTYYQVLSSLYRQNQNWNLIGTVLGELLNNFTDDHHHPAPTFTPPELPKRVHVREVNTGNDQIYHRKRTRFMPYDNLKQIIFQSDFLRYK